jgi:putative ABC transport system permease protein
MKSMAIGDQLEFKVQGIPVKATISSIRSRTHESVKPFFYFVFPEDSILKTAPQTIFTAVRVPTDQLGRVQTRVVSRFPNVSAINVTQTLVVISGILQRLTGIIRFFTAFSVLAGILIIVSSVFATRFTRIQEAVYFKILGARNRFISRILALENILIGGVSAVMAILISQTGSWLVCTRYFDITYQFRPVASLAMVIGTVILVMTVGGLAARPVLKKRPAVFLREQTEE